MTPNRRQCRSAGFTVVELLVTTLITGLIMAGFVGLAGVQVSTTRDQSVQIDTQHNVRNITEMFAREVRRAGANPTCATSFSAVETAAQWMIRVKADLNGNGSIDSTGDEDVTYQYYFGELRRIANGSIEVLMKNVDLDELEIRYYDKDGQQLNPGDGWATLSSTNRAKIRRVELDLKSGAVTDVSLRNRFFVKQASC